MLPIGLTVAVHTRMRADESWIYTIRPPAPSSANIQSVDWEARTAARRNLLAAVNAIDELERVLGTGRRGSIEPARATSSVDIGLDPSPATASTLNSVAEVNATPTSFSPYGPSWTGTSTAALVLDGEYDGSDGSGTFTFESRRNGTHGEDNLRILIRDPLGTTIGNFNIQPTDPPDEVYTLANGMTFTLGPGDLVKNDTLTVDVSASVGTVVDPDRPLDGTGNDDARLESALIVRPGNFTVNGSASMCLRAIA